MKRIITITAAIAMIALAAAACGGGGSVTIPGRVAAVHTEPATVETYCALETQAVAAIEPFLREGKSPLSSQQALVKAVVLANQVAVVAPDAIASELSARSRLVANLLGAVVADRYDVGSVGPHHPALVMRSPTFIGVLDQIGDYDTEFCGIAG
jgi:hypothetical protein